MRNKIYIYNDTGSNDISYLQNSLNNYFKDENIVIRTIKADEIIKDNLLDDTVLAFFMPGGKATPYMEKLKTLGNEKIRSYVANGGVYFGICAGAYYASKKVYFEANVKELAIIQECELNLIDAQAIGTLAKEFNISQYSADVDSYTVAKLQWLTDNSLHISSYHGGPYFMINNDNKTKILANYKLDDKNLPAIVCEKYGKGKAIAVGVHFENNSTDVAKRLELVHNNNPKKEEILNLLTKGESNRIELFNKLMLEIKSRD